MAERTARILLAEDDRFLRKAAEATLRRQGFTVLPAIDGEEALRLARAEVPDLILLDLIMPKLQGFEVLQGLKEDPATASIPVIVLTSLAQDEDRDQAMACGATAYFVKASLSLQDLVRRVEETLAAETRGAAAPGTTELSCAGRTEMNEAGDRRGGGGLGGGAARGAPPPVS